MLFTLTDFEGITQFNRAVLTFQLSNMITRSQMPYFHQLHLYQNT